MSRVPVRIRLVLAFAAVMGVVLAGTGLFVYLRLAGELGENLDRELAARLAGVVAIVRDDGDDLGNPREDPLQAVEPGAFVQVLDEDGSVAGSTAPKVAGRPVLSLQQARALADARRTIDVSVSVLREDLRLAVARAPDDGVTYTVIVGASLEERGEALSDLGRILVIGGPIVLLFASMAGYGVATGALRPVEHMRRRAAELFAARETELRLPVPPARDEIAGLGRTLNEMLARIDRAFARERAFTADASHELRTPLSILKAEVDLALDGERSPAQLEQALCSVAEETERLIRLAEDLLVLARADEGLLPLTAEPLQLGAVAECVVGHFAARADEAGRNIAVHADADEIWISADPLRLEQALSNLVENALRYGDGEIIVCIRRRAEQIEVHVIDDGDGFIADLQERAFDRFVGADTGPGRGGAGLGLSIVAAIAAAHGGSAHAENRAGGGADVWIALPAPTNQPLTAPGDDGRMTNRTGGS
jgi:two-component system, OmpR family, sensor kinase